MASNITKVDHATLTPDQVEVLAILQRVLSALSLSLLLIGLAMMIYLKQYSKPHHKLVLILFLTLLPDAFQATVIVASWTTNHVFCTFSGIIDQFSFVGGCAWFVTITINLYRMLVLLHRFTSDDFPMMHWIVWSYTLMMCFLPLITNSYVPIGSWCWISGSTTPGKVMRFTTFYGP